jgi:hypothetical protein
MSSTALREALKRKFSSPREVLRRLGLDEDLLARSTPSGGGGKEPAMALRQDLEMLLGELGLGEIEVGKILEVLDKHAPTDRLDDSDPNAARARETAGDDEEEERRARMRDFLKATGMDDDVVEKALAYMPKSGTAGGMGGRLAGDTYSKMFPYAAHIELGLPTTRDEPQLAFDRRKSRAPSAAEEEGFYSMFPDARRIG